MKKNRLESIKTLPTSLYSALHRWILSSPCIVFLTFGFFMFFLGSWLFSNGNNQRSQNSHNHSGAIEEQTTLWTCSMHPQIKMPQPGRCPICGMDLIPLKRGKLHVGPRELAMSAAARKLAEVETTVVEEKWVETNVPMFGKIRADERKISEITARFPGRLERLFVDFTGTLVQKGDHLALIYSPELLTAQSELTSSYQRVTTGDRESGFLRESSKRALEASRDKLRLWGLTEEQIARIEKQKKPSDTVQIDAPMGGIVTHKYVKEGDYVKEGTPMFQIVELSTVWVMLDAYEADLPWLRYGQSVSFTSESYPGKRFEGKIAFISPVVDPKTRTVKVRVNASNPHLLLKPEMFVRGVASAKVAEDGEVADDTLADKWISPMHPEIIKDGPGQCDICGMDLVPASELGFIRSNTSQAKRPLVIPASAVLRTGNRAVVYVEKPSSNQKESLFEGREVVLGPRSGDDYIVKSGLQPGERVVTKGNFKIDSSLQIEAKPSMMSMEGGPLSEIPTVSPLFLRSLESVYAAYFQTQEALANDHFTKAINGMKALVAALERVSNDTLKERNLELWNTLSLPLKKAAIHGTAAKEIDELRQAFQIVSQSMIALISQWGHTGSTPYIQVNCPMAFHNQGADWLQPNEPIANPYFGKKMLHCGTLTQEFPPIHGK